MNCDALKHVLKWSVLLLAGSPALEMRAEFVHPGGLHTQADLDRMRTHVLAGESPWIQAWRALEKDPLAQSNWKPAPRANMGDSRQRADQDAHAAYLNALRWCISGDNQYADCAVRICNAWSSTVDRPPSGNESVGLGGITIFHFALAGELLRIYPQWEARDFNRFTNMMARFFYPACHDFLSNHNGRCTSYYWANWDACNIGALIAIGVLCDNTNIFNEGVDYFRRGEGMGSISNAVPFRYSSNLAQWQESGRDQEHAQLGVGLLAAACQVAWNQGVDLFGEDDNRLLAGAEYVAKCNLSYPHSTIPYTFYNNCAEARQFHISMNGIGRIDDRPVWELVYNHYTVLKGLPAPFVKAMASLVRPEHGSKDHFGYGTLTFTLSADASPYPPAPAPPAPSGLQAEGGVARVFLSWNKSQEDTAQGYVVSRSSSAQGPFIKIAEWNASTAPRYIDTSATNDVTYYYVVAGINQAGTGATSRPVAARPGTAGSLPAGWNSQRIGQDGVAAEAAYSEAAQGTFLVKGSGGNVGGTADNFAFTRRAITGDFEIQARLSDAAWSGSDNVGLMVRESEARGARTIALTLGQIGNRQCRLGTRAETSGKMTWQPGNDYTWVPVWFKIRRAGNLFTGYQSVDGQTWFLIGASEVPMAEQSLVGFAVAGRNQDTVTTGVFDHVLVRTMAGSMARPSVSEPVDLQRGTGP